MTYGPYGPAHTPVMKGYAFALSSSYATCS